MMRFMYEPGGTKASGLTVVDAQGGYSFMRPAQLISFAAIYASVVVGLVALTSLNGIAAIGLALVLAAGGMWTVRTTLSRVVGIELVDGGWFSSDWLDEIAEEEAVSSAMSAYLRLRHVDPVSFPAPAARGVSGMRNRDLVHWAGRVQRRLHYTDGLRLEASE